MLRSIVHPLHAHHDIAALFFQTHKECGDEEMKKESTDEERKKESADEERKKESADEQTTESADGEKKKKETNYKVYSGKHITKAALENVDYVIVNENEAKHLLGWTKTVATLADSLEVRPRLLLETKGAAEKERARDQRRSTLGPPSKVRALIFAFPRRLTSPMSLATLHLRRKGCATNCQQLHVREDQARGHRVLSPGCCGRGSWRQSRGEGRGRRVHCQILQCMCLTLAGHRRVCVCEVSFTLFFFSRDNCGTPVWRASLGGCAHRIVAILPR